MIPQGIQTFPGDSRDASCAQHGAEVPPALLQALQTFLATYGAPSLQALEQQLQAYEADWNRYQEALALHTRKLAGLEVRRKELLEELAALTGSQGSEAFCSGRPWRLGTSGPPPAGRRLRPKGTGRLWRPSPPGWRPRPSRTA